MIRREVWYFSTAGPENTKACLDLLDQAMAGGYRHIVAASTTGESGVLLARRLVPGVNLVVVGHSVGFRGPNTDEFLAEHSQDCPGAFVVMID